jgi:hypothetical protein
MVTIGASSGTDPKGSASESRVYYSVLRASKVPQGAAFNRPWPTFLGVTVSV